MKTLRAVLAKYAADSPRFGPAQEFPIEALRTDQKAASASNGRYFAIVVGMLVVLFAAAILLVATSINEPARAAAVLAATGISIPWIIKMMKDLWMVKVYSDSLLALASTLEPDAVQSVIQVLSSYLARTQNVAVPNAARAAGG
jgi:hypothetical protein